MKYPHVNNYLKYHSNPDGTYTAVDYLTDQEYKMDYDMACILRKMDGRRPLSSILPMSRQECSELENELFELDLLRKSRIDIDGPGCIRIALWMDHGSPKKRWRRMALFLHRSVRFLWLPVMLSGLIIQAVFILVTLSSGVFPSHLSGSPAGYFVGFLTSIFLHELSHAASGMAYGATVFEAGFGLTYFFPCGYVIMDESDIKLRSYRTRMLLAGVRMNFLLAGFSLFMPLIFPPAGRLWMGIAYTNLVMGFMNLSVVGPTDGYHSMRTMLGIPETWDFEKQKQVVLGAQRIRSIKGINQGAVRLATLLMMIYKAVFVLFIILEVCSLLLLIFE